MMSTKKVRDVLVLVALLVVPACDKAGSSWRQAQQANTIQAYESFLKAYPSSNYAGEAHESLERLALDRAETAEACRSFIKTHPASKLLQRAQECVQAGVERENWQAASKDGTRPGLRAFIDAFPKSKFVEEAKRKIVAIDSRENQEWQALLLEKEFGPLESFLRRFPDSTLVHSSSGRVKQAYATQGGLKASVLYNPTWIPGNVTEPGGQAGWVGKFELVEEPGVVYSLQYPEALADKIHLSGGVYHLKDQQGKPVTLDDRKTNWEKFRGKKVAILWFSTGDSQRAQRIIASMHVN